MASANCPEVRRERRCGALAAGWGFAEATLFFIVPDVLLSRIALESRRRAFVACLWALAGALAGGLVTWAVGHVDPDPLRALFDKLPAIGPEMIARVRSQIETAGPWALFVGPLTGTPYKLYALEASGAGVGAAAFLLISVPARLVRFAGVSLLASAVARRAGRFAKLRTLQWLHALAWLVFYAAYFNLMAPTS